MPRWPARAAPLQTARGIARSSAQWQPSLLDEFAQLCILKLNAAHGTILVAKLHGAQQLLAELVNQPQAKTFGLFRLKALGQAYPIVAAPKPQSPLIDFMFFFALLK